MTNTTTPTGPAIADLTRLTLVDGLPATLGDRPIKYREVMLRETTVADERAAVRMAERAVQVEGDWRLLVSTADYRYALTMRHIEAFECDGMKLHQASLDLELLGKLSAHDLQLIEERIVLMELAARVRYGQISAAEFADYAAGRVPVTAAEASSPQPLGQTASAGEGAAADQSGPALLATYVDGAAAGAAAGLAG